jgi:TolB-like protein
VEENNLAQHISTLRRVLGESETGRQFIETIPKRGYRFMGPVTTPPSADDVAADEAFAAIGPPASVSIMPEARAARRRFWALAAGVVILSVTTALAAVVGLRIRARTSQSSATALSAAAGLPSAGPTRIAVLPFLNLGSQADDYFAAGMTEEITSRLAALNGLAVASSTTAAEYDRHGKNVRRIGADLGVAYLVEGSVRWSQASGGAKVRITQKLVRVADDTVVWTQQYDAALADIFAVQADIARRIAEALPVVLEARASRATAAKPTADAEAYLAFLRGITKYQQGGSVPTSLAKARAELEEAVSRDPRFAVAWSWLARVLGTQYATGAERTPEVQQAAERAAHAAIDLDPALPEAHMALSAMFIERDNERALRELEIARAGLPNSPEVFRLIGALEQRRGRWTQSLGAYMHGFNLDPAYLAEPLAVEYLHLRQYPEAKRYIEIAKAANRLSVTVPEAWARFSERGDIAAARRLLEAALDARPQDDARARSFLARLEWFDGRHQRALDLIHDMDSAGAWMAPDFRFPADIAAGQVYETMGRRADASKRYEAAIANLEARRHSAPDDYQIEAALGMAAAGLGRGPDAVRHAQRAAELIPLTRNAAVAPLYLYLLAQIHSQVGDCAAAFDALDRLFSVPGFYSETWIQHDPGFARLRSQPEFGAAIDRWSRQKGDALLRPAATLPRQ